MEVQPQSNMKLNELIEISRTNPKEAHRLFAEGIGARGHAPYFAHLHHQECIREAMSKPLPGAAADALINGALKVNGRMVYEVVPTHIKCLQALNSPLLQMGQQAAESKDKTSNADLTEGQQWELCYIFTTPPREMRLILRGVIPNSSEQSIWRNGIGKTGAAFLKSEAERIWSDKSAAEINVTIAAILNQYGRHFQTTVKFAAEMEASGDVSFFRELNSQSSKPAESAGSLTTSAVTGNTTPTPTI